MNICLNKRANGKKIITWLFNPLAHPYVHAPTLERCWGGSVDVGVGEWIEEPRYYFLLVCVFIQTYVLYTLKQQFTRRIWNEKNYFAVLVCVEV